MRLSSLTIGFICVLGCGTKAPPTGQIAPPPPSQDAQPAEGQTTDGAAAVPASAPENLSATLTGVLTDGDESRGKTLAAWNGIPVGERFYHLELDGGQTLHSTAADGFMIRAADQETAAKFVSQRVTITGKWEVPTPVEVNPEEPMQMPISSSGDVMQRATIFIAETIQAAE